MVRLRSLSVVSVMVLVLSVFGCGGDEESEPESSGGDVAAEAEALLGPVESALENPTGLVNADTAKVVLQKSQSQSDVDAAAGAMSGVPGMPSGQPQDGDDTNPYAECVSGGAYSATVDMGCLTDGEVTGTVTYKMSVGGGGGSMTMVYEYDQVCSEGTCIDGKGAYKSKTDQTNGTSEIIMVGDLTITRDGETIKYQYGYKMTSSGGEVTYEYVVWDDAGNTYVLNATISEGAGTGSISISGENGEYTCEYQDNGATGSCTGPDGSFSW